MTHPSQVIRVLAKKRWINVTHEDLYRISLGYKPGRHFGKSPATIYQALATAAVRLLQESDEAMDIRSATSPN